jgi:solute carrier family 13 (sodium-dependent dicarboxylate transporter), member 2/3/5
MALFTTRRSRRLRLRGTRNLRSIGFFVNEKRWLFIALLIGMVLFILPTPEGLSVTGKNVLIMAVVAVILFVSEPVPLPAVALLIIVGEVLLLKLDSKVVAQSLMSDSVLFIMGSLMLAVAIVKQKLDTRIAYLIVRMTGTGILSICMGVIFVCGVLASIIGEHTVAAMMLPVAVMLVTLTSDNPKEIKGLAAVLLFSISYGCAIGGIGTPSGGARNAIMIGYWKDFFFDPTNPETRQFLVSYVDWMKYAYPLFLIQIPFVAMILFFTFKPERKTLRRAVAKLRQRIEEQGKMKSADWMTVFVFFLTLLGWIFLSGSLGLGTIAIMGAMVFLFLGLVRWEDLNSGVNWGVVWLYAATISLGVQMQNSGAAEWVSNSFLSILGPMHMDQGISLAAANGVLTTLVTNTMSAGAAVAVLGPISLHTAEIAGENPLIIGYVTAVASSFAYFTPAAHPAFMIVYASGYLKAKDFLIVGVRMAAMSFIILMLAVAFYWPFLQG